MKILQIIWRAVTSRSVAFLLAVGGIAIAAYSVWFYHPRPGLAFQIDADTKVLDVHADIRNLDITYNGESLQSKGEELRIVVLRIVNDGEADITKNDFDTNDPVGFHVINGELLDAPDITASNSYIARFSDPTKVNASTIVLRPVVLESRDWLGLKLLVAVPAGVDPVIKPFGKIAGVREFQVVNTVSELDRHSLWDRITYADSWWIQFIRGPIYMVVFLLTAIGGVLLGAFGWFVVSGPFSAVRDFIEKRRRRGIVTTYAKTRELKPADHFIVDEYLEKGPAAVPDIRAYVKRIANDNQALDTIQNMQGILAPAFGKEEVERHVSFRRPPELNGIFPKAKLLGLVTIENERTLIAPEVEVAVNGFEKFLRESGERIPEKASRFLPALAGREVLIHAGSDPYIVYPSSRPADRGEDN